jgi:FixJ family two-component response regulator
MFRKNKDHIAAVLSDLGLPKLSGEETVAFIKQEDPQARVIIASGFIDPDVRSGLEAAGVKDFIQKPYVSNEVLKVVQNTIEKGKT